MNIDIDMSRINLNEKHIEWKAPIGNESLECLLNGMAQVVAAYESVVDENELFSARLPRRLRPSNISGNANHFRFLLHRCELVLVPLSEDSNDALAQLARDQVENNIISLSEYK